MPEELSTQESVGGAPPATPLHDRLHALGACMGTYAGVRTALRFGDPAAEFRALTRGCAVYDLGWRAKVFVAGDDRVRWLNGMVTNKITDLPVGRGNYSFVLNPQGRIQGDLYTYNLGARLLLDTERSQLAKLLPLLDRYIIMDDVELQDASDTLTALGVQGPESRQVLSRAGIDVPELEGMEFRDVEWRGTRLTLSRMESERFETYEAWIDAAHVGALWDALLAAGATPAGADALERFRVLAGVPKYGVDVRDRDLPQETRQDHALNFSKGCYIGQEIVERIRSRGNVHRIFTGFVLEGDAPPPGAALQADGRDVGELTSVQRVPGAAGERTIALGYARREALDRKATLHHPGGTARPHELPFSLD